MLTQNCKLRIDPFASRIFPFVKKKRKELRFPFCVERMFSVSVDVVLVEFVGSLNCSEF